MPTWIEVDERLNERVTSMLEIKGDRTARCPRLRSGPCGAERSGFNA